MNPNPKEDRRLAAIMFTDIVGSTAIMAHDENAAVEAVSRHKQVVEDCASKHQGEVMNFYGDGSMSLFPSATSVVLCAMEIQQNLKNLPNPVQLHIGIHIGEVLVRDGQVFGDGVNVASRIESLGQPGTILFSEEIHRKIRNNKAFETALVGSFEFKNVDEPMDVYALSNPGFPVPKRESVSGKLKDKSNSSDEVTSHSAIKKLVKLFLPGKSKTDPQGVAFAKSIAVLPFEKSGNGDHDILGEGLADEIRNRLLNIAGLKVISRTSCRQLEHKNLPQTRIARQLGVEYLLEGRILSMGQQAQLSLELSHAREGKLVWSMPARAVSMNDFFNLVREVPEKILNALQVKISREETEHIKTVRETDPEAFLYYQQGQELLQRGYGHVQELDYAVEFFKKAVARDPHFTKAWVGLCDTYLEYIFWGRAKPKDKLLLAQDACLKALELDRDSGEAWGGLGSIYFYKADKEAARSHLHKAVQLSPGYVEAYAKLGWIYSGDHKLDESIAYFRIANELDPLTTKYIGDIGQAYYFNQQYEKGVEYIEENLSKHPGDPWLLWILGFLYAGMQRFDEAIEVLKRRTTGQTNWLLGYCLGKNGNVEEANHILEVNLKKRELDFVPAHMIATIYLGLDDIEKALEWLEKDEEEESLNILFWDKVNDPIFKPLRGNPRFEKLIR